MQKSRSRISFATFLMFVSRFGIRVRIRVRCHATQVPDQICWTKARLGCGVRAFAPIVLELLSPPIARGREDWSTLHPARLALEPFSGNSMPLHRQLVVLSMVVG